MKALILNSGFGSRMGVITKEHPKCMTDLNEHETILSRQLQLLCDTGITQVVITTGYYNTVLEEYCAGLGLPLHYEFVLNPVYDQTNYIYSIYCAKAQLQDQDVLLLHGDLVFEESVLQDLLAFPHSCMKVSSTVPLPEKDFKAVICDGKVQKVGIEFFENAMEAQAMYKLNSKDWNIWLDEISAFCESDNRKCYAEVALNQVTEKCIIYPYDVQDRLCAEIDNPEDLEIIKAKLAAL